MVVIRIIVLIIIVVIVGFVLYTRGQRTKFFRNYCSARGYRFDKKDNYDLMERSELLIGTAGAYKVTKNVITFEHSGRTFHVFERQDVQGKSPETVCIASGCPHFEGTVQVRTRLPNVLSSGLKLFAKQTKQMAEVTVDSGDAFSRKFMVLSDRPETARAALSSDLRSKLLAFTGRHSNQPSVVFGRSSSELAVCVYRLKAARDLDDLITFTKQLCADLNQGRDR